MQVEEVKFKFDRLNDEDVFLIDLGLKIFQVKLFIVEFKYMTNYDKGDLWECFVQNRGWKMY